MENKTTKKNICDKYKASENKSYIIASAILETILEKNSIDKPIEVKDISDSEYFNQHKNFTYIDNV